jgi:hypothetical protein
MTLVSLFVLCYALSYWFKLYLYILSIYIYISFELDIRSAVSSISFIVAFHQEAFLLLGGRLPSTNWHRPVVVVCVHIKRCTHPNNNQPR